MIALGVLAAIAASALYNVSIALQALEARRVPHEHSLRPSLIGRLARNRRWLGATVLGLLGWPLEVIALLLAPLTLVQPCIASGLILLLWLGTKRLGEAPGRREAAAVAAIVVGVVGVAWAAPDRTTEQAGGWAVALAAALIAVPMLAPYAVRHRPAAVGALAVLSAGFGYAWTGIASKLLSDALVEGLLLAALGWLLTAVVSEGIALLSEMTAVQRRAATHAAPPMFALQVVVPVIVAPLIFGESWRGTPLGGVALAVFIAIAVGGSALLAASPAVGSVLESAHSSDQA